MNWVIVGQGALGSLLASKLQQQGQSVSILTRHNGAAEPRQLDHQQLQFNSITLQQLILQAEPTIVIAAVKAYQVEALLAQLSALSTHCQLLLSYNGMLDDEAQLLPANCLHWVTTHGAYRDGEQVLHAGLGQSWLGWQQADYAAPPQALLTDLGAALPPLQWKADIHRQRWHKLAINCLLNPFTVLHNCRNGELLNLPVGADMLELASEISALARQLQQLELAPRQLVAEALAVAEKTANNRSSMLSDVLAGRPTESAYLNGFVVRQSAKVGLTASANQRLWQQLQQRGA